MNLLGQDYLTTADPFDPNYNTPDQHRDLKKLTCPNEYCGAREMSGFFKYLHACKFDT